MTSSPMSFCGLQELLDAAHASPGACGATPDAIRRQYLQLLSQLTLAPDVDPALFRDHVRRIHAMGRIVVAVVGGPGTDAGAAGEQRQAQIVGSGTIIVEPKLIHGGRCVGHIEDVVVAREARGAGVAQTILDMLTQHARVHGCYKVILDCDDAVQRVYAKNGFAATGLQMSKRFDRP